MGTRGKELKVGHLLGLWLGAVGTKLGNWLGMLVGRKDGSKLGIWRGGPVGKWLGTDDGLLL